MFGKITKRTVLVTSISTFGLTYGSAAFSQTSFENAVLETLRCETPPSPLPILLALENASLISAADMLGFDSVSCFRIHNGIVIAGARFNSVCAHEENDAIRKKRPDILWRGPGTSPGQFISFGSSLDESVLARWYFDIIGTRHLNEAIDSEFTNLGDRSEVTCSSWFAR